MSLCAIAIDDSPLFRELIAGALRQAGFKVLEAENGQQGLDLVSQNKTDVVVTDLNMPVLDGMAMTQQLRENAETCGIPVIMVSTEATQQRRAEGRRVGVTGWIAKPFEPERLIGAVRRVCG